MPEVAALWRRAATLDKEVARASPEREAHRHADVALAFVRGVVAAPVGVSGAGKGAGKGKGRRRTAQRDHAAGGGGSGDGAPSQRRRRHGNHPHHPHRHHHHSASDTCCFYMPVQWAKPRLQWAGGENVCRLAPRRRRSRRR